ncbi:MAG: ABC transporter substrate-binding protein [Tissierellia bacterium]|nr:ABC transporter substrate-binding protein [Tissierellia bacterium]
MNKKNLFRLSLLLILVIALLAGCGKANETAKQDAKPTENSTEISDNKDEKKTEEVKESEIETKDEIIYVAREINDTLDPAKKYTEGYLMRVCAAEPLFKAAASGEILPLLAKEAIEIDANTWEIKLREEAKFWSGKKVTAEAVRDSLERSRELSASAVKHLEGLSFEPKSDYELIVKTEGDYIDVPLSLSLITIVNADMNFETVDQVDMTGCYKIVDYVPKTKLVLEAFEDYYGDVPKIKHLLFEEINDEETRVMAALSGRADVTTAIPVSAIPQIEANDDLEIYTNNPAGCLSVYLNLKKEELQDVRVRQALSWGLNRQEASELAFDGYGTPTSTWLGSNPLFPEAKDAVYDKYDKEKAEKLLADAGWEKGADGILEKNGEPFTFKLYTWGGSKLLGEVVQNQWRQLGIDVKVEHVDYSIIKEARETGDWDGLIEAWTTFGNVHANFATHVSKGGGVNYSDYDNPKVNAVMDELQNERDPEVRRQLILKVNELVAEDAPFIAIMPSPDMITVNKRLEGYIPHFLPAYNVINNHMEFVK